MSNITFIQENSEARATDFEFSVLLRSLIQCCQAKVTKALQDRAAKTKCTHYIAWDCGALSSHAVPCGFLGTQICTIMISLQ